MNPFALDPTMHQYGMAAASMAFGLAIGTANWPVLHRALIAFGMFAWVLVSS